MKENEKTSDFEYESPLEVAKMYFETGHGPTDDAEEYFETPEEYEEYLQYIEMGPAGFYEAFKDDLDFDDMFVQEYGDSDEDDEESLSEITCPHCQCVIELYDWDFDEDERVPTCPGCGKEILLPEGY